MVVSIGLWILFASTVIPVAFSAIGPVADMHIVNKIISPDGFPRSAILVDGVFPGPLLKGRKGDKFKVNVVNELTDNTMERTTSIHWHGITQSGTNYNDGVGFITQCPIIPGGSYKYDFQVLDQAGTFWYHSHVSTQPCDGLKGPLVIYDSEDPHADLYDVDDESTIITLSDWYHLPSPKVKVPAVIDSVLINGYGRYAGGPAAPLAVVNVEAGKRYRFRLFSMACDPYFNFTIDGHRFIVIEVEGTNVKPLLVDSMTIYPGQRYSFILEANEEVKNYWIRADPQLSRIINATLPDPSSGINTAILRYVGAPAVDPTTPKINGTMPFDEIDLRPLDHPGVPGEPHAGGADVVINLNVDFDNTTERFLINNLTFQPPSVPVLLQILSGARKASELLPNGSLFTLPPNKVVELSIPPGRGPGTPHPWHLHGHSFDVVRSAGSTKANYINPVRRDVVSTGNPGDNVTIRFVTDNSGPWFLHCHIDWHLEAGLAVVFAEDMDSTASHSPVTDTWKQLCPTYNEYRAQLND